jgi:hypothetical protein
MTYTNVITTIKSDNDQWNRIFYSQILFVNKITAIFTVFLIVKKCDLMN